MGARISPGVVGFYLFLMGLLVAVLASARAASSIPYLPQLLVLVLAIFLLRYVSTTYSIDTETLRARRLFGSRRVPLDEVRRLEYANLRDLAPVSMIGGWGWRGRMWSAGEGPFDAIHTVSEGILVVAGAVPLFISPRRREEFFRELSRRVRSYHPGAEILGPRSA
jgi:hypothetical protein